MRPPTRTSPPSRTCSARPKPRGLRLWIGHGHCVELDQFANQPHHARRGPPHEHELVERGRQGAARASVRSPRTTHERRPPGAVHASDTVVRVDVLAANIAAAAAIPDAEPLHSEQSMGRVDTRAANSTGHPADTDKTPRHRCASIGRRGAGRRSVEHSVGAEADSDQPAEHERSGHHRGCSRLLARRRSRASPLLPRTSDRGQAILAYRDQHALTIPFAHSTHRGACVPCGFAAHSPPVGGRR